MLKREVYYDGDTSIRIYANTPRGLALAKADARDYRHDDNSWVEQVSATLRPKGVCASLIEHWTSLDSYVEITLEPVLGYKPEASAGN